MAEIILTGSIVLIFVGFGYLLIDCLMSGQKQKPVAKQKAKPVDSVNKQVLKDRIEIKGTNVTDPNVYTQDWRREETPVERMERLEALKLKQAKRRQFAPDIHVGSTAKAG